MIANLALALEREDIGPAVRDISTGPRLRGANQVLQAAKFGLARQPALAHLAELDRPSDDARIERRIVVLQLGERSRPFDLAARCGRISTSKWNGLAMTVSAPALDKPAPRPRRRTFR